MTGPEKKLVVWLGGKLQKSEDGDCYNFGRPIRYLDSYSNKWGKLPKNNCHWVFVEDIPDWLYTAEAERAIIGNLLKLNCDVGFCNHQNGVRAGINWIDKHPNCGAVAGIGETHTTALHNAVLELIGD